MGLNEAINNLIKQDMETIANGEVPERRLIPHHAIKRDMLLLGFEKDFSRLSSTMQKLNKDDFDKQIRAIKQLSHEHLDEQLKLRMKSHKDLEELEDIIREKSPIYKIVPRICRGNELCLDTLAASNRNTKADNKNGNIYTLNNAFIKEYKNVEKQFNELKTAGKNINTFNDDEFSLFSTYCILSFLIDFTKSNVLAPTKGMHNNPYVYFEIYCYIDAKINQYFSELSDKYDNIDGFDDATIDAAHLLDPFYELLDSIIEERNLRNLHLDRYELYFNVCRADEQMALMFLSKFINSSCNYKLSTRREMNSQFTEDEKSVYNSLAFIKMSMGVFYLPIDEFLKSKIPSLKNKELL